MWWCPDGHPSMLPLAYNQLRQAALNLSTSSMTNTGSPPPYLQSTYCQHPADFYRSAVARFHHHPHDEPKPQHSYIGLIAMAILSTPEQKMILSDVYQWILDNYAYFRARGPGWRNSIRHNLSLNDCFIKSGRSANGKGHYWAIHPANLEDFTRGDFRRRRAQRKVRRHMGLAVADDDDDSGDESPCLTPAAGMIPFPMANTANTSDGGSLVLLPKKRFDVESLLAPDHQPSTIAAAAALYAASNKFGWTIWPSPPSFELSPSSMPTIAPREVTPPVAIVDDNAASSRSESPNTAAQWQTSFARIMARSYHHNQQQHQSTRKHDRSQ